VTSSLLGVLAQRTRRRLAISGKAITVMIYPSVVLLIACGLFTGLLVGVVPMLAEQIQKINPGGLPWYSELVFGLGTWLRDNLTLALVLVALALVGALAAWRPVLAAFGALGRRLPALRRLLLSVELTRFFSVMAAMSKSGVPLADALGTSARVITNARLRGQLEWLRQSLVDGGVLRTLLEKVDTLPLATRRLLIAAERGGDLDSAFDALAEDMASDVEQRSARLLALLEPAVIVAMFAVLAPLVVAVAVPMMTTPTDF
jgi:type II secretory pathway component PulF